MIAIGGPPLGGKSVLAARLAECLPHAMRLEAIDDLSRARPYWIDGDDTDASPTAGLLERARRAWRSRPRGRPPTILVVTRFSSSMERRRAKVNAQLVGMPFLFVEARSRDDHALRRIPMNFLSRREIETRLRRYNAALLGYAPVSRTESIALPALRLQGVLSRLDESVDRVVAAWKNR